MKRDKKEQEGSTALQYVRYYDSAYDYEGVGLLTEETSEMFYVTSVIGGLLTSEQTTFSLNELPAYPMLKPFSHYTHFEPKPVPDWVLSFSVQGMNADDIHHAGQFLEEFLMNRKGLCEGLEEILTRSRLKGETRTRLVEHILSHYRKEGHESLLACAVSPLIQSALHRKGA